MIESNVLTVQAKIMNTGSLFIWGTRQNQGIWDVNDLKYFLFAWHEPSFYGTFIEQREWLNHDGIELPALDALHFFCDPKTVRHIRIHWNPLLHDLMFIAPFIQRALLVGQVIPDYQVWKKGTLLWKLQLPDECASLLTPDIRLWIQSILTEWVKSSPSLQSQMDSLRSSLFTVKTESQNFPQWLDEEDWLVAIGWKQESRPTRTCLQLIEPKDDGNWKLQIVIQDRLHSELQRVLSPNEEMDLNSDWPSHWNSPEEFIFADISRWSQISPSLFTWQESIENRVLPVLREELDESEAWRFLSEESLKITEAGYAVIYPAWWLSLKKTKPKLRAKVKSTVGTSHTPIFGMQQLVDFDWRLAIGDIELTEEEFRQLLVQKQKLVLLRGQWIQLDSHTIEEVEQLLKKVTRKKGLTLRDVLELHFAQRTRESLHEEHDLFFENKDSEYPKLELEVELNDHLSQLIHQLNQHQTIPVRETPTSFHGHLRQYQQEGASWLLFLRQYGFGGLLADDMGLGKTIQWITYLLYLKEQQISTSPSLLICPTSVLGNWQMELKRFAPSLAVYLHYGTHRLKGDTFLSSIRNYDLILTSYTLSHLDVEELSAVTWNCICLDEAQHIKNAYTKQSMTIRKLQSEHRVALTGTPIENRLTELWSIFDFINPGYLGSVKDFSKRFVSGIEKEKDFRLTQTVQKLIRPFLLRRMKKDPLVQLDLPEKNESTEYVPLTIEQSVLYENYIQEMFREIDQLNQMERRGTILKTLTQLKQLCNHPALVLKDGSQAKWRNRSNKLERLLDMVRELRLQGDKCLIFTQFVETGVLLQQVLASELQEDVLFLHGSIPKSKRDEMISLFQQSPSPSNDSLNHKSFAVFILSLKAGGVGLNLTAANHVFHFDRWWNPAVEKQATDRAYRWGQTRHVQVHKFVTMGTLEEKINEMIERKLGLSEQIVNMRENWITELSTDELKEVFRLRNEWV